MLEGTSLLHQGQRKLPGGRTRSKREVGEGITRSSRSAVHPPSRQRRHDIMHSVLEAGSPQALRGRKDGGMEITTG